MISSYLHRVGNLEINNLFEIDLDGFEATRLLPGLDPAELDRHPEWLDLRIYEPSTGTALMSVHTWVVRGEGATILVDTGAGNDKDRPTMGVLNHLHTPYLERLAELDVRPEDVDLVLLTHVHADHVGWNTRSAQGRWVPTFPNATVVCSDREWRYGAALAAGDAKEVAAIKEEAGLGEPVRVPVAGVFEDSVAPLADTGRLRTIAVDGSEVLPGIRFHPTPGHSVDHAAIEIASGGETAIFGGDVLHHPFEIFAPSLVSMFCEFPEAARRSRRWLLERAVETGTSYFSSHFPASSAGRIVREAAGYGWRFEP